ncbi:MAG: peptide chain release factor N(5)-glutamine methyltransferase [Armatimonadota bacterium]
MTLGEALVWAASELSAAGVDSPRLDAEALAAHVIGSNRAYVLAHPELELPHEQAERFRAVVQRRAQREPLPYILGTWEFYGRPFVVTPSVLIPRPETEVLVEAVLERLRGWSSSEPPLILDVGTGSGCIALTLALEAPACRVVACDISPDALDVARANAERLLADARKGVVQFRCLDFPHGLDDLFGRVDILVSNPPYVAEEDVHILPPEVACWEPKAALFAEGDGLSFIRRIAEHAPSLLRPQGIAALEVGVNQACAVADLLQKNSFADVEIARDLAGIERVVIGRKR